MGQQPDPATFHRFKIVELGRELTDPEQRLLQSFAGRPHGPRRFSNDPSAAGPGSDAASAQQFQPVAADVIVHALLGRARSADHDATPLIIDERGAQNDEPLRITGFLNLRAVEFKKPLELIGCRFDHPICLRNARMGPLSFVGSEIPAIDASGATFDGDVTLASAVVSGFVPKDELPDTHPDVMVHRSVSREFHQPHGLTFRGAVIRGHLNLHATKLNPDATLPIDNTFMYALNGDAAEIIGSIFLRHGFKAIGNVKFTGAIVGGQIDCTDGSISNPNGSALNCDAIKIGRDVFVRGGFRAQGTTIFVNAKIGGTLDCRGATFDAGKLQETVPGADALDLRSARIEDTLNLTSIAKFVGGLDLRDAYTKNFADDGSGWPQRGSLKLDGFVYDGLTDYGTEVDKVEPEAEEQEEGEPPSNSWWWRLFRPNQSAALNRGETKWRWRDRLAWLELQRSRDLATNFKPQPFTQLARVLAAAGYDYDAKMILTKRESFRFWRVPARSISEGIRKAFLQALIGLTAGFGYHPLRAVYGLLVLWLVSGLVFSAAAERGFILPITEEPLKYAGHDARPGHMPPGHPPFNEWAYALDVILPVVNLQQENYWMPVSAPQRPTEAPKIDKQFDPTLGQISAWLGQKLESVDRHAADQPHGEIAGGPPNSDAPSRELAPGIFAWGLARLWYWIAVAFGWILTTIAAAGFAGLLRRD